MSTAKQEKIQQHYDEIADVYELTMITPAGGAIIRTSAVM